MVAKTLYFIKQNYFCLQYKDTAIIKDTEIRGSISTVSISHRIIF